MDQALAEVARVLRPGGYLYVSEPVYAGPLNEIVCLYNDEGVVARSGAAGRGSRTGRPGQPFLAGCSRAAF